jgi:hypothetical protein
MRDALKRVISLSLGAAVLLPSAGCGTILHPERRGQRGGNVDAGVAVLDGIGLFFFILPGVIAFAVDFSNGTIYLPPRDGPFGGPRTIRFDPSRGDRASIEAIVRKETGVSVRLDRGDMRFVELGSAAELPARFAAAGRAPRRAPAL